MDIGIISEVIKNSYGIKNEVIKNLESSVGNVYDVVSTNSKYIVKIYNDFNHVCKMIELSKILILTYRGLSFSFKTSSKIILLLTL